MANVTILKDFYQRYPYRKNSDDYIPGITKTIPYPYVKKEDVSDHKYAVDFKTYKLIMHTFLDLLCEYLIQGGRYKMPGKIGDLIIYKYKRSVKNNIKWHIFHKTGNHSNEKNIHTNRYSPTLKWKRNSNVSIRTTEINWWNFLPSRAMQVRMGKYLAEDSTRINNYQTYSRK